MDVADTSGAEKRTGRRGDKRQSRAVNPNVRQLPTVRGCGHKIDISKQPKHRNCQACWTGFFRNQPALAENIAKNFADQGPFPIMWTHGRKFLTKFMEYATLLAKVEALKEAYARETRDVGNA
jgi:hypothetical protein